MSTIHYAVEITTEMTEFSNTSFGLTAGIFRWVTDRPNYDGNDNPYPLWENDSDNTYVWYEDILLKNSFSNPIRKVDISQTGDYGTLSGFSFSIRNDLLLWKYIRDNNIYFVNRKIVLYAIIDDKFYQIWTGVISNNPYDEIDYQFICIDKFKKVHKTIPPLVIDKNTFPTASTESQGSAISIVVGDNTYSNLQIIQTEPEVIVLNNASSSYNGEFPTKAAAAIKYVAYNETYPKLSLYTAGKSFALNELADYFVYVTKGADNPDIDQLIKIKGNAATSSNVTVLELESPFDDVDEIIFNKFYTYDPAKYRSDFIDFTQDWTTRNATEGWATFANLDCSNNGVGINMLHFLANSRINLKIEIHEGDKDGELIGSFSIVAGDYTDFEYPENITCQYSATETITIVVKNLNGTPANLDSDQWQINWFLLRHTFSTDDTWWFSITSMNNYYITSNDVIKSYTNDYSKTPYLFYYDSNKRKMIQSSFLLSSLLTDRTGQTGHPEVVLYNSKIQKDGNLSYVVPIIPPHWAMAVRSDMYMLYKGSQVTTLNDTMTIDTNEKINDRNMNTYVEIHFPNGPERKQYEFTVDIAFPQEKLLEEWETFYVGFDMDIVTNHNTIIFIDFDILDVYGDVIKTEYKAYYPETARNAKQIVYPIDGEPISSSYKVNMLPEQYYDLGGTKEASYSTLWKLVDKTSTSELKTMKASMELDQEIFTAMKDGMSTNSIRATVHITSYGLLQAASEVDKFSGTIKLKQVGFVGVKSIDTINDDFYVRTKGEMIDGEETNNVYNTFRLLLETYDGISVNDISYNNLAAERKDWPVGRQITERKSSFDYLRELCAQSFVSLYPDRNGKRALKAWREDTTIKDVVTQNTILRDSITSWKNTEISDLYNDFRIWYNYNQATQSFDSSITVTNAYQTVFPAITTMQTYPPTLETWKTYVGGLAGTSYSDAKEMWDTCHSSYLRCAAIQPAPDNISKMYWYNNANEFKGLPNNGASIDDSAYKFLKNMLEWTTRQKAETRYSKAISSSNIVLELLDYVSFSDTVFTANETRHGWITAIEVDINNDRIIYDVMLKPEDEIVDNLIIERGKLLNTRIFTESGSQADQVDDGQDRT